MAADIREHSCFRGCSFRTAVRGELYDQDAISSDGPGLIDNSSRAAPKLRKEFVGPKRPREWSVEFHCPLGAVCWKSESQSPLGCHTHGFLRGHVCGR